jgi:hypothetical protein
LKPLKTNEALTKAANDKLVDMFEFGYWDHYSPAKRPPWTFILENNYDYHYAGENLAKDFSSATKLVDAWMDSSPHRANILSDKYDDIGIAVAYGELNGQETMLVVQMFAAPFKLQDYEAIEKDNQILPREISTPLLESRLSKFEEVFSDQFSVTKICAAVIVLLLLFSIMIDIVKQSRLKKVSRKHWGHLLFLLALGTLIWLTGNGYAL